MAHGYVSNVTTTAVRVNLMFLFFVGRCITSLCWRPDGKAIGVGLDDGTLSLYDVEVGGSFLCSGLILLVTCF